MLSHEEGPRSPVELNPGPKPLRGRILLLDLLKQRLHVQKHMQFLSPPRPVEIRSTYLLWKAQETWVDKAMDFLTKHFLTYSRTVPGKAPLGGKALPNNAPVSELPILISTPRGSCGA